MKAKIVYKDLYTVFKEEEQRGYEKYLEERKTYFTTGNLTEEFYIETIFIWKKNYYEVALNSKYNVIKQYLSANSLGLIAKDKSSLDRFNTFINTIYRSSLLNDVNVEEVLRQDVNAYIKAYYFFIEIDKLIELYNNDLKIKNKIPSKNNFEIGLLKNQREIISDQLSYIKILQDRCEKLIDKEKKELNKESENNDQLRKEISKLEKVIEALEDDLSEKEAYCNVVKDLYAYKKPDPVNQFNKLYWGDNYPALKVFYDFLLRHNMIDFGWSYFSNIMSIGNNEPFCLECGKFTQNDVGYLLDRIKPFFLSEYSRPKSNYTDFLVNKLYVDYKVFNEAFANKYVRGYNKDKTKLSNQKIIDNLCTDIKAKYK